MGIARGMMKVLVVLAAIALVALAVEDAAEVKEMDESRDAPAMGNGGDDTHPAYIEDPNTAASQGAFAEGTGYYKRMNNFVGPKYGLPGYKESHNWNDDYDILSPLVFDYRFYRALIKKEPSEAALMSEEDLKTEFSSDVQKKKTPECPQGNVWFNANTFYTMNKDENEFTMGGNKCPGVFQMYLTKGLYEGWGLSLHQNSESATFPTLGSRLFNPVGTVYSDANDPEPSSAYYQVQSGRYVPTPAVGTRRDDNTFSPARHMTIVFWLKFGNFDEAPNAELFAYGGKPTDNYFRTGVGCLSTDMLCQECYCYFIFVMQADATEYFHTYQADNFDTLKKAFSANKWAHVLMMLTTAVPGGYTSAAGTGCPRNANAASGCEAVLELYVETTQLKIVDWSHGTRWRRAGGWDQDPANPDEPLNWGAKIGDVWSQPEPANANDGVDVWIRRFWLSAPQNCKKPGSEDIDVNRCGDVDKNGVTWMFPWFGAYMAGVYVCDFASIPSGVGGFGAKARRLLARDAFYDTMSETVNIACSHTMPGGLASNTHAKVGSQTQNGNTMDGGR